MTQTKEKTVSKDWACLLRKAEKELDETVKGESNITNLKDSSGYRLAAALACSVIKKAFVASGNPHMWRLYVDTCQSIQKAGLIDEALFGLDKKKEYSYNASGEEEFSLSDEDEEKIKTVSNSYVIDTNLTEHGFDIVQEAYIRLLDMATRIGKNGLISGWLERPIKHKRPKRKTVKVDGLHDWEEVSEPPITIIFRQVRHYIYTQKNADTNRSKERPISSYTQTDSVTGEEYNFIETIPAESNIYDKADYYRQDLTLDKLCRDLGLEELHENVLSLLMFGYGARTIGRKLGEKPGIVYSTQRTIQRRMMSSKNDFYVRKAKNAKILWAVQKEKEAKAKATKRPEKKKRIIYYTVPKIEDIREELIEQGLNPEKWQYIKPENTEDITYVEKRLKDEAQEKRFRQLIAKSQRPIIKNKKVRLVHYRAIKYV